MYITSGIKHLVAENNCFWLPIVIASYQPQLSQKQYLAEFQLWELTVDLELDLIAK
jgi:hypothetical protein